jgi:uncharacterized protein (DUF1015 family)
MAEIRPFQGLQYNPAKVRQLADVISLPYDVISPEHRVDYTKRSPWNIVRLILPDGPDPYANAATTFQDWLQNEILVRDPEPCIYSYHQAFQDQDGQERVRKGFIAAVRLENFDRGVILPHEATLFAPKEDRLNLLRACKTNFSPIFGLYADPELKIDKALDALTEAPPRAKLTDETGVVNTFWAIRDQEVCRNVCELMKEHWVLIADGHHRYESCLVYRDEMAPQNADPNAPFQFTLMYFTNIHHPGIAIFPYNRGIANLAKFDARAILRKAGQYFDIREFDDRQKAQFALRRAGEQGTAFLGLLQGERDIFLFVLKPNVATAQLYPEGTSEVIQKLDVNILHRIFVHTILGISEEEVGRQTYLKYYKELKDELKDFESGKLQIAFLMNPTKVDQVVSVARAGEKMPQKSTFFYPKLMTGFVMNQHS